MLKKKVLSSMAVLGLITTSVVPLVIQAEEVLKNEVAQVNETEDTETVDSSHEDSSTPAPGSDTTDESSTNTNNNNNNNNQESSSESESQSSNLADTSSESSQKSESEDETSLSDETSTFEVVPEEDIEWIEYEVVLGVNPETGEVTDKETVKIPDLNKYFAISKGKRMSVELTDNQWSGVYRYAFEIADTETGYYGKNESGVLDMLPEYKHTLFTNEGWLDYKEGMEGAGYKYLPETDTFEWIPIEIEEGPMQNEESDTIYLEKFPVNTLGKYSETAIKNATDVELSAILGYSKIIRVDLSKGTNLSGTLTDGSKYTVEENVEGALLIIDGGEYLVSANSKGQGTMEIGDSSLTKQSQTLFIIHTGEDYKKSELPFGTVFFSTHALYGQEDSYKTLADLIVSDEDYEFIPEDERPTTPDPNAPIEEEPTPEPGEEDNQPEEAVTIKSEVVKEVVEFDVVTIRDDSLAKDETKVVVEGKDGEIEVTYEVYYQNGKEIDRIRMSEETTIPYISKVVYVGTGIGVESGGTTKPNITPAQPNTNNSTNTGNTNKPSTGTTTGNNTNEEDGTQTDESTTESGSTTNQANSDIELEKTGIKNPIFALIGVVIGLVFGSLLLFKSKKETKQESSQESKEGGNIGE